MLAYNEVRQRKIIILDGEPYIVLSSHVFRKQMRKPVNQTKLKHLISGKVIEYSLHQTEKVEEAEIPKYNLKYLYRKGAEFWFSNPEQPSQRVMVPEDVIGDSAPYLIPNSIIKVLEFEESIIGVELPIKQHYKVKEAPPNIKGNTATGGTKQIILETGLVINAPLFIDEGDTVEVNTETGEYVTRIEKR